MSKFEAKGKFPRFPSFRFWVWGKIENSEIWETFTFSSQRYSQGKTTGNIHYNKNL